jgi:hypothetical protein
MSENVAGATCTLACSTGPSAGRHRRRVTLPLSSLPDSRAEAGDFTGGRMGPNGFPRENPAQERLLERAGQSRRSGLPDPARAGYLQAPGSVPVRRPHLPGQGHVR